MLVETLEPRQMLSVTLPDDVNSTQTPNGDLAWLTDANGTLLFADNDGLHGPELYKSNGTADSTSMVLDINPAYGVGSAPRFSPTSTARSISTPTTASTVASSGNPTAPPPGRRWSKI